MRKECSQRTASFSVIAGWRFSIWRPGPISRWVRRHTLLRSCSTARSTTFASCARRSNIRACVSVRRRTPRSCWRCTRGKAHAMLGRLRGMFAIAIWDTAPPGTVSGSRSLRDQTSLLFARPATASCSLRRSKDCWHQVWSTVVPSPLAWPGFISGAACPSRGRFTVTCLRCRPGTGCTCGTGQPERLSAGTTSVCTGEGTAPNPRLTTSERRVREALIDSVRAHLVSDVPVGVFLSGGIDSAVLTALASELGASLEGITVGFDEFAGAAGRRGAHGCRHRGALRDAASRAPRVRIRVRARRPTNPGGHGSAVHRRRQHVVRQQSSGRARPQGRPFRCRRRRAVLRVLVVCASAPNGRPRPRGHDVGRLARAARRTLCLPRRAFRSSQDGGPAVPGRLDGRRLFPQSRPVPSAGAARADRSGPRTRRAGPTGRLAARA